MTTPILASAGFSSLCLLFSPLLFFKEFLALSLHSKAHLGQVLGKFTGWTSVLIYPLKKEE